MGNEQTALSFGKGITNVPSDAICDDNALEECMGMVYDDGEHRVIQKPVDDGSVTGTLVFMHSGRRITTSEGKVWYGSTEICPYTGSLSISAIGNTLVMSHDGGVKYAKWNGTEYVFVGGLPDIMFRPFLVPYTETIQRIVYPLNIGGDFYGINRELKYINNDGTVDGPKPIGPWEECYNAVKYSLNGDVDKNKTFQDYITGAIEDYINTIKKDYNAFIYPFWVRFALELYDGSITKHSAPILVFPSVRAGISMVQTKSDGSTPTAEEDATTMYDWFKVTSNLALLHFKLVCSNIEGYEDVVKGVKIYISKEVRTEKTNDDKWNFYSPIDSTTGRLYSDYVMNMDSLASIYDSKRTDHKPSSDQDTESRRGFYRSFIYAPQKTDDEIMKELIDTSVFYELCDVPYSQLVSDANYGNLNHSYFAEDLMTDNALVNLETLTQMPHDDYFSHTINTKGKLFAYNSRINMFAFERKAFTGFRYFMSENTNSTEFIIVVSISTESGTLTIKDQFTADVIMGYYFYYPDPRANKVDIYINKGTSQSPNWKLLKTMALKEHPYLNGAYAFETLPYDTGSVWQGMFGEHAYTFYPDNFYLYTSEPSASPTTIVAHDTEDMYNTILTTEVNNPFVSYAEGSNRVGDSRILGLATQTVALSSGTPFGSQPLIVFTENGLWAMSVSKTGLYDNINPMPREVCNNTDSITPVDGAVFFSSEKGLMVTAGSAAKCVSEQLSGKSAASFATFLKTAVIAYDYRDSLLWIFNRTSTVCWIYNIKSGTFAHYDFGTGNVVTNVVNDYPDYLLQIGSSIYSLLRRPNINDDGVTVNSVFTANTYSGQIITRPMKFDNALALKSIRQIMTVKQMEGSMTYRLFASNDLQSWVELSSLRGMPWKYYKLRFDFSRLKATDRFGGAVIVTQERRTNKLR